MNDPKTGTDLVPDLLNGIAGALARVAAGETVTVLLRPGKPPIVGSVFDGVEAPAPKPECGDKRASGDRCTEDEGHEGGHRSKHTGETWPKEES